MALEWTKKHFDSLMNPLYLEYSNKLGLGLSFLKQNTELCDGNLLLFSEKNIGTRVIATFKKSHPNRPPIGDIAGVISLLMCGNPEINFIYLQRKNNKNFEICTNKIKAIMKNIPINHPKIRQFVKDSILESIIEFNIE